MAIQHQAVVENGILVIRAQGFDESLEEVQAYGLAVVEACRRERVLRVLCDERDLDYRLGTLDTFQAAAFISDLAPKVGRAAIVPNAEGLDDAAFWEDVAVNRGLTVRVFRDPEPALAWLSEGSGAP